MVVVLQYKGQYSSVYISYTEMFVRMLSKIAEA